MHVDEVFCNDELSVEDPMVQKKHIENVSKSCSSDDLQSCASPGGNFGYP